MTTKKTILKKLFITLFKCKHDRINRNNQLSFCPDCGKKINFFWLKASCSNCNKERETVLIFNKPYSLKKECPACKSTKYKLIKISELPEDQLHKYALIKEDIIQEEDSFSLIKDKIKQNNLKKVKNNTSYKGLYKPNSKLLK